MGTLTRDSEHLVSKGVYEVGSSPYLPEAWKGEEGAVIAIQKPCYMQPGDREHHLTETAAG